MKRCDAKRYPSDRKPLLLLVLAAIGIGGAWWWKRPPAEPVVGGVRLSEYLDSDFQWVGDARPYEEKLKAYGPKGVAWLAYKLEYGRPSFSQDRPTPLDSAPDWLRQWFPERWGGLHRSSEIEERIEAARLLDWFGPQAAPAIAALVRCLESEDGELVDRSAHALISMGPPSWPAVREILEHGSEQARIVLFDKLYDRLGPGGKYADPAIEAELPSVVESFIKAFHDPNAKVRAKAAYSLGDCVELRDDDDPCYDAALPILLQLLSDRNSAVMAEAARTVGLFKPRAASAIPRLIEMLNDTNPPVRSHAAWALLLIDAPEHSMPRLRAMLQDPDSNCRQTASEGIRYLDYARTKEGAGEEVSPPR